MNKLSKLYWSIAFQSSSHVFEWFRDLLFIKKYKNYRLHNCNYDELNNIWQQKIYWWIYCVIDGGNYTTVFLRAFSRPCLFFFMWKVLMKCHRAHHKSSLNCSLTSKTSILNLCTRYSPWIVFLPPPLFGTAPLIFIPVLNYNPFYFCLSFSYIFFLRYHLTLHW